MHKNTRTSTEHALRPHSRWPGWEECTTCEYVRPVAYGNKYDPHKLEKEARDMFRGQGYKGLLVNGEVVLEGCFSPETLRCIADAVEEIQLLKRHERDAALSD